MPQSVDLYAWRNAIMSANGPANPLARCVLMAISLHMKADGTGAWPAQSLIAIRAGVGERSARRHLEIAERHGWVERLRVKRSNGNAWYRTEYAACVPDAVYEELPERPWEADPTWRREQPATVAGTSPPGTAKTRTTGQSDQNNRPTVQEYRPTATEQPANDDRNNRPSFGRLTLPLNSSSNSSKNSPPEGALARTDIAINGLETKNGRGEGPNTVPPEAAALAKRLREPRGSARKETSEERRQRMEGVVAIYTGKDAFTNYGVADLAKIARVSPADMTAYLNSVGIRIGGQL